jgi:hypothetical protein
MSQAENATTVEQLVSDADHVQLSRLVTEHAWRVDNGRADTLHELYVDDGESIVGPTPLRGRQAIYEWGRQLVEAPPWSCIRHVCGNMRFVADGANAAEGTTVLTVFLVAGPGAATALPWMVGEDHDRFVRTGHGWRLVSRRWVELFTRGDVVDLP